MFVKKILPHIIFFTGIFLSIFLRLVYADDCGVRGYDGDGIVKLDCETTGTTPPSPLQVAIPDGTGGFTIRGLNLVEVDASNATNFRVRYTDHSTSPSVEVIKAIGKILPGISSCEELQMIGYHPAYPLTETYKLACDLDCSATNPANWSNPVYANQLWELGYAARYPNGFDGVAGVNPETGFDDDYISGLTQSELGSKGFKPIGYSTTLYVNLYTKPFAGVFDGMGYLITGLTINRSDMNTVGLFGAGGYLTVDTGHFHLPEHFGPPVFRNIKLENVNIIGGAYTGALLGIGNATISRISSSGSVTGSSSAGGLVGYHWDGIIAESYSSVTVISDKRAGGLAAMTNNGIVRNCYATGSVTGGVPSNSAGGLVGQTQGRIYNSYATGSVNGAEWNGGFVGYGTSGPVVTSCFCTGRTPFMYCVTCSNNTNNYVSTDNSVFWDYDHPVYNSPVTGFSSPWDFEDVWVAVSGELPHLKWQDE